MTPNTPRVRTIALAAVLCCALDAGAVTEPTIASTNSHVLVSKSDGAVAAWGSDLDGKLGTGRPVVRYSPAQIPGLPPITQVASYNYGFHFVARDTNGRVWTWGQNDAGQLGPRVQRNASLPGRVQGLSNVIQVAATVESSIALKSDGSVWVWGSGSFGAYAVPTRVQGLSGITQISASSYHFFARRNDGTVWGVGWNSQNQLGVGAPSPDFNQYGTPTLIPIPAGVDEVVATVLGGAARAADGRVWSWGSTSWTAAGDASPRLVTGFPAPPTKLIGGSLAYNAVLPGGALWQWGASAAPTQVAGFSNVLGAAADSAATDDYDQVVVDTLGHIFVRSSNAYGERGLGTSDLTDPYQVTQVPSPAYFVAVRWTSYCVLGVGNDGKVWAWGAEVNGSFGDGAVQTYPVPRSVAGLTATKQVAAGRDWSAALDESGNVRVWGDNPGSISGTGAYSPNSSPVQIPITDVKFIAAGWSHLLMLKNDGTVWMTGYFLDVSYDTPTQVANLPAIGTIAAGLDSSFAVGLDGKLYVWGRNAKGELGTGDTIPRPTPTEVVVPGGVARIAAVFQTTLAVTPGGALYGWGDVDTKNTLGVPSSPGDIVLSPQVVAGASNVVEVAMGQFHYLARRGDGSVLSWGPDYELEPLGRDTGPATPPHVPSSVLELDSATAIAAGNGASYAIRADGTVWGWGLNWASGYGPTVGDGTFVRRSRPVLVIRENALGNLDTNDWFLDAKPGTAKSIPAAKVPKVISVMQSLSSSALLNVDGSVNVRVADQAKTLGLYVTGLVPPAFLDQVSAAPGAQAKVARMKADQLVLVNLTPAGWTVAAGQLEAYRTGLGGGLSGATSLLVNINPATIPGARFCIGYGESATDMLKTGTIRDFLSLEGAASTALDLPCLLSGVYVDGPPSSSQGSAVQIRAVVVGQAPTGTVRFQERFAQISPQVAITPVNAAVSDASFGYTPSAAGEYAFGASYGGDAFNAVMSSEIPLRHVVRATQVSTTTQLEAPLTSEVGMEVRLIASITGNRPAGTVQFLRDGVNEGAPVPVVDDHAVISVVGLAIGAHSFTAVYSGDASNQPSTSSGFAHQVLDVATSAVALGSSANPAPLGDAPTLTATVSGSNPTGTVALREGAAVLATKSLVGGSASFTLTALSAGVHVFNVDYAGDANNPAATSNALFQQVTLNLPPSGDLDGDGIPNGVEFSGGTDPSIRDNDIFGNARLFAMQQYRDFLGREGDAGGIASWTNYINGGGTRAAVTEGFFGSNEFQGTGSPVVRLYFAYFLRIPDYGGLTFWMNYFRTGHSLIEISNAFAGSAEFLNRYGALTNAQFVDLVYQNVLNRAADAGGKAFWLGQLNGGMARGQMMIGFSESAEYTATIFSETYVTMMYIGMLKRAPDTGGFTFWVGYLDAGNSGQALINGFLGAQEYRSRFLP